MWILRWIVLQDLMFPQNSILYMMFYVKYFRRFFGGYFSFQSLIIASMMYTYIVQNDTLLKYVFEKTKKAFYLISIVLLLAISIILSSAHTPTVSTVNDPWKSRCVYYFREALNFTEPNLTTFIMPPTSSINALILKYISKDVINYVGMITKILKVIIILHIMEGRFYLNTSYFMKR